jgi:hypothetical protein
MNYVLEIVDQNDEPLDSVEMNCPSPSSRIIHCVYSDNSSLELECFIKDDLYITETDTFVQYATCYMKDWMYERFKEIMHENNRS